MLGLLVLPFVVVTLLRIDTRGRRPPAEPPRSPYAL
jgi:hypothetical protein